MEGFGAHFQVLGLLVLLGGLLPHDGGGHIYFVARGYVDEAVGGLALEWLLERVDLV